MTTSTLAAATYWTEPPVRTFGQCAWLNTVPRLTPRLTSGTFAVRTTPAEAARMRYGDRVVVAEEQAGGATVVGQFLVRSLVGLTDEEARALGEMTSALVDDLGGERVRAGNDWVVLGPHFTLPHPSNWDLPWLLTALVQWRYHHPDVTPGRLMVQGTWEPLARVRLVDVVREPGVRRFAHDTMVEQTHEARRYRARAPKLRGQFYGDEQEASPVPRTEGWGWQVHLRAAV